MTASTLRTTVPHWKAAALGGAAIWQIPVKKGSIMNSETLKYVAWTASQYIRKPIRGVILTFHGLGSCSVKELPTPEELAWAEVGGLAVFPYYGPWSWMNRAARQFTDELVKVVYEHYKLPERTPLISTGGSMGGHAALLYARYAKRPVKACLALYPACDLKYHFTERPDLPRTILYAFRGYPEDRESLFAEHSPLAQVDFMPKIPYLIVHGDKDAAVSKVQHSDRMVAAMRRKKLKVEYVEVPGMGHGGPMPIPVTQKCVRFVTSFL